MIGLGDQIKAVAREIAVRRNVYPKLVARGRMSQDKAAYEIQVMEEVLHTLQEAGKQSEASC